MLVLFAIFGLIQPALAAAETSIASSEVIDLAAAIRAHVIADTGFRDVDVDEVGFEAKHRCTGQPEVRVDSVPGEKYRGQTQFKVRLVENDVLCGRFSVPARVTIWRELPVAAGQFRLGEAISTRTERVASQDIHGDIVDVSAGSWVASRTIRDGQPITARYVKRKPAAAAGDSVAIVAQYGGLTVKAEGRMLTNAHLGDWVRVANLSTDTVIQGKLVAPDVVRAGGRR